ncbi:MAG: hypothetical protein WC785_02480, partial [Tatlockia sp.]
MARNLPPWQAGGFQFLQKQKKLILADWTAEDWDYMEIAAVYALLSRLMTQGFEVYTLKKNKLRLLKKAELNHYYCYLITQSTSSEESITKACDALHWQKKQILLLNSYWIQFLLHGVKKPELLVSQLADNADKLDIILAPCNQMTPAIEGLVIDQFSSDAAEILPQIINAFPTSPITTRFRKLVLNETQMVALLAGKEIGFGALCFSPDCLLNVLHLQVEGNLSALLLQAFLEQTPHITRLYLCHGVVNGVFTEAILLKNCKILHCNESVCSAENLQILLKATPKLEQLTLRASNFFGEFTEECDLSALKWLHFSALALDKSFQKLLAHSESLEMVYLQDLAFRDGFTASFRFPNLKYFIAKGVVIRLLEQFIAHSPQIYWIDLSYSRQLNLPFGGKLNLKNLRHFNASKSDLSILNLQAVLSQATRLESLYIQGCKDLQMPFPSRFNLNPLKVLWVNQSALSAANIAQLCLQTGNVRTLAVTAISDEWVQYFQWITLKKLVLTGGVLVRNLRCALAKSPNLTSLTLCCDFDSKVTGKLSLSRLTTLTINSRSIDTDSLKTFLKSAPNLKTLILGNAKKITMDDRLGELLEGIILEGNVQHRGRSEERSIDADTVFDPETEYCATQFFFPIDNEAPPVKHYRLLLFDTAKVNENTCAITAAFTLKNQQPINLIRCFVERTQHIAKKGKALAQRAEGVSYYHGRQRLQLTTEWQALASLSPHEILTHIQITPPDCAVDIQYSQRDNLYYIKSLKQCCKGVIDFLVAIKHKEIPPLPTAIEKAVNYFTAFEAGSLAFTEQKKWTGKDYLKAIIAQKKGSCRHRAVAFKAWMQKNHPETGVRVVANECHAFVEVLQEEEWVFCDLGGYVGLLTVDDSLNPGEIKKAPTEPLEAWYEKALETWVRPKADSTGVHPYCEHVLSSKVYQKKLIE